MDKELIDCLLNERERFEALNLNKIYSTIANEPRPTEDEKHIVIAEAQLKKCQVVMDEAVQAERERIANALLAGVGFHEVTKDHLVKYANRLKRGE